MASQHLAFAVALLCTGSATAQSWTAPVMLGQTTEGRASLSMSPSGYASAAFAYVTPGNNGVGSVSLAHLVPGAGWSAAQVAIPASYDAWLPGVGQDNDGNDLLLANAGQFDNFSAAVVLCGAASGILGTSCGTAATNITNGQRPIARFYGAKTTSSNPAAYVLTLSCTVEAVDTSNPAASAVLTRPGECARTYDFGLNAQGAGVIGFISKTGAIAVANRGVIGGTIAWSTTTTLYQAAPGALPGSIAVAIADDGEAIAIWTLRPKGTPASQAWAASMSATGVWANPVQLSLTACTPGVAAAALPDGTAAAGFGAKSAKGCELTVSLRAPNSTFAAPLAWTSGAHIATPAAIGTAGGNFVVAYRDSSKSALYAVTATVDKVGTPEPLGKAGTPSIAAGNGQVTAVWCTTICYGSFRTLP